MQFYLGIECIVFCGGVASFNVFCVLVTYPPGRRSGGEFLVVQGTAAELYVTLPSSSLRVTLFSHSHSHRPAL
jgi:hypothetical protein